MIDIFAGAAPAGERCVHFLLIERFSMIALMSALEPLRVANRFNGPTFSWRLLSTGAPVVSASNGLSLLVDGSIGSIGHVSPLFVVASFDPLTEESRQALPWLRQLDRHKAVLGALDSGCFLLAEAHLLDHARVTMHWESIPVFRECYPEVSVSEELYEAGPRRLTCAGGAAGTDMMLDVIAHLCGDELAIRVSEQFVRGRTRDRRDHQRMQLSLRYGVHDSKLIKVLEAMESHLEDPLNAEQLSALAGVSKRQMERLFQTHLDDTPTGFYLKLRLGRARQYLQESDMSVMDICIACGFESASYFSRAYRKCFGRSPRQDRDGGAAASA